MASALSFYSAFPLPISPSLSHSPIPLTLTLKPSIQTIAPRLKPTAIIITFIIITISIARTHPKIVARTHPHSLVQLCCQGISALPLCAVPISVLGALLAIIAARCCCSVSNRPGACAHKHTQAHARDRYPDTKQPYTILCPSFDRVASHTSCCVRASESPPSSGADTASPTHRYTHTRTPPPPPDRQTRSPESV